MGLPLVEGQRMAVPRWHLALCAGLAFALVSGVGLGAAYAQSAAPSEGARSDRHRGDREASAQGSGKGTASIQAPRPRVSTRHASYRGVVPVLSEGASAQGVSDGDKGISEKVGAAREGGKQSGRQSMRRSAMASWPGFQMREDGGSRVFVQLTGQPSFTREDVSGGVRIRLANTRVPLRNNLRRIDTRHFATPVAEIKLSRRGRDAVLDIRWKSQQAGASARARLVPGERSHTYLLVDVPAGEGYGAGQGHQGHQGHQAGASQGGPRSRSR